MQKATRFLDCHLRTEEVLTYEGNLSDLTEQCSVTADTCLSSPCCIEGDSEDEDLKVLADSGPGESPVLAAGDHVRAESFGDGENSLPLPQRSSPDGEGPPCCDLT